MIKWYIPHRHNTYSSTLPENAYGLRIVMFRLTSLGYPIVESYLYNGISFTGKMASLFWTRFGVNLGCSGTIMAYKYNPDSVVIR